MILQKFKRLTSEIKMKKPLLFAFDFDHTIADENTDHVAREMVIGDLPESIKKLYHANNSWTAYMRNIFELLHSQGITRESIEEKINAIPAVSGFEDLLTNLHSNNCEIIIISDSNSVFITNWLKKKKLEHTIAKVFTNPAWFDENGLLNIEVYHTQDWCKLSEKNLCKGHILETYIKERSDEGVTFDSIAYAGDGKNDFCPILRLSKRDTAFPRFGYRIMKVLKNATTEQILKADIVPWKDGNEIWEKVKKQNNF